MRSASECLHMRGEGGWGSEGLGPMSVGRLESSSPKVCPAPPYPTLPTAHLPSRSSSAARTSSSAVCCGTTRSSEAQSSWREPRICSAGTGGCRD